MKKTLLILILVLAYQFTNAQVKVLGKIEPNGATDKYPTHVDSLGRGGLMTATSWQERNAIPTARRKAGMLVRVKSASVDSTYTLGVGLTDVDWVPYTPTANITNINQIPARSYNDLQDKPSIPDNAELLHTTGAETKNGNLTLMGSLILPNNNQVSFSSVNNSYNGYLRGDGMQFSNLSGNIRTNFSNDGIRFRYNGSGETVLRGQTISSGATNIQLPSASGTLALTSEIPSVTGKANLVGGNTFSGNQFVNGEFKVYNPDEFMYEGKMFMNSDVFNIVTPYNLKISGGSETQFITDFLNASIAETRFTGNVGIGMTPISEKLEVNGNAIFIGSITADSPKFTGEGTFTSEDGFIFKHPDSENTNYAYINYGQLGFIGNGGSATFGAGQIASNVFNAAAKNNAFLVNLGEAVPTLSLTQDNIGNTIKPNLLGGNVTTTLPAVTGTLVTMEQVLAMTAIQTAAYHGADISGTTVTVATSPSRYKKLYIYKPSEIGSLTVFKMPANPTIGDLVEIISIAASDPFPSSYIEIQNSAGTFISYGKSHFMAYRWSGTTWVDESTE